MLPNSQVFLTLDHVSKLFSDWRESRSFKGPIPESLIRAVARLDPNLPIRKVANVLRLNPTDLKRKLQNLEAVGSAHVEERSPKMEKAQGQVQNQGKIHVTKIVAVEKTDSSVPSSVEIVSPDGWVLRSSSGPIKEAQILDFARAVSGLSL
jgi:hypothetical protein